jgi:hypothetical protein
MMRGTSGDECGNLLGQEYNRPAREAGVLKKPREATLTFNFYVLSKKFHNIDLFPACHKSLLSITYHNLCDCTETYRFDELLYNLDKSIFLNNKP